jgi:hypothetical protein
MKEAKWASQLRRGQARGTLFEDLGYVPVQTNQIVFENPAVTRPRRRDVGALRFEEVAYREALGPISHCGEEDAALAVMHANLEQVTVDLQAPLYLVEQGEEKGGIG